MTPREQSAPRARTQRDAGRAPPLTPEEYAERRRRYVRESTRISPRRAALGALLAALAFLSPLAVLVWAEHAGWSAAAAIIVALPLVCLPFVYVLAGIGAMEARAETAASQLGLTCPRCGLPFVYSNGWGIPRLDKGRCRDCRTLVIAAPDTAAGADEPSAPRLTRAEFVARTGELEREDERGALAVGAVLFVTLGGVAFLVLPERRPPLISDGAAVAVALSLFVAGVVGAVRMGGRWLERVRGLGLECGFCDKLLVGGPSGRTTRATIRTGICSECGNRAFRDEE